MKKNNSHQKAYESKKKLMELKYKAYRTCFNGAQDDRGVFCNIYDQTMEALEVMKGIDNNLIWCGFHKMCEENFEEMDKIITGVFVGVH